MRKARYILLSPEMVVADVPPIFSELGRIGRSNYRILGRRKSGNRGNELEKVERPKRRPTSVIHHRRKENAESAVTVLQPEP